MIHPLFLSGGHGDGAGELLKALEVVAGVEDASVRQRRVRAPGEWLIWHNDAVYLLSK